MRTLSALFLALILAMFDKAAAVPPFPDAGGTYSGLAFPVITDDASAASILTLRVMDTGSLTGTINQAGFRTPLRGRFNSSTGEYKQAIRKGAVSFGDDPKKFPHFVHVRATLDGANLQITGHVEDRGGSFVFAAADFTLSGTPPDAAAGDALAGNRETSFIEPPDPSSSGGLEIPGDGFAVINIGKTKQRSARLAGKLPDGGFYSAGTPLQGTRYAVLSPLYSLIGRTHSGGRTHSHFRFRGVTYGYGDVVPTGGNLPGILAPLRWHKAPTPSGGGYYTAGIKTDVLIDARHYPRLAKRALVPLGLDPDQPENAIIKLQRGNLDAPMEAAITIKAGGVKFERMISATGGTTEPNPYAIKLRINAALGIFSGSFDHPDTGKKTKFSGAFRAKDGPNPGEGRGAFRGDLNPTEIEAGDSLESGSVRITVNTTP